MAKHLIDLDEEALGAARAGLGTETIKETVNRALRIAGGVEDDSVERAFDALARIEFEPREAAWR